MLDDIIETLNFLDQDLLENVHISSDGSGSIQEVTNKSPASSFHPRFSSSSSSSLLSKNSHKLLEKSPRKSSFDSHENLESSMISDPLNLSEDGSPSGDVF
ncbi:hypothetical protein MXB_5284, partial [Myxobolus squamalis]